MTRRLRGLVLAVCLLLAGFASAAPAHGDSGDISLSVLRASTSEIHVGVCLGSGAVDQLPFNPVIAYDVTSSAGTVASATWSYEDPEAALVNTNPCPAEFVSFAIECLAPGTLYTFTATATLTPRLKDDLGVTDTERTVRTDTASVTVTTRGNPGPGGCPADDPDGSAGSGSTDPGADAVTVTPSTGVTSDATSSGTAEAPVVIDRPDAFRPAQLAALSPQQVASIEPAVFGQLPPAAFTALNPAQAAALTPEQASAIRPARAARLGPATVRSLSISAIEALRPAAVKFLTPAAVGAMTTTQLRALTPRQVAALRPKQLAALTAAERALLRR
ncbi:MAG: hypothetical protein PSX37_02800 [bacterium]|nr:hypothetical protein [bacterium]